MADRVRGNGAEGAPDKLTEERADVIVETFRVGGTQNAACGRAGISVETMMKWKRLAREPEPTRQRGERKKQFEKRHDFWTRCNKLIERIEKATGDMITSNLATIRQAAVGGSWQASAWLLERRHPDDFSLRVERTGARGEPMRVDVVSKSITELLDDEELSLKIGDAAIDAELARTNGGS